jgi:hypothetical protein
MSGLQFTYQYSQAAAVKEERVIAGDVIPSDPRNNVQVIVINVPPKLLSRVFSFEKRSSYGSTGSYGGRLKMDFLPVKEYLDVLDFKLLDKNIYSFYDDKSNPNIITNLASVSNTIAFSTNDPLSKLPASAILNTTIKELTKDPVYTTFSTGPIDTAGATGDYGAINDLFDQAIAAGMITDNDGNFFPFTDLFSVNFVDQSSLSIKLNYTVSKNRTYQYWGNAGAPMSGTIKIGNVEINLGGTAGYHNSTASNYTVTFVSSANPSNFSYSFSNGAVRSLYDDGILATQILSQTTPILNFVAGVTGTDSLGTAVNLINTLNTGIQLASSLLGNTAADNEPTMQLLGFRYVQQGITTGDQGTISAEYSRILTLAGITGTYSFAGYYDNATTYSQNQVICLNDSFWSYINPTPAQGVLPVSGSADWNTFIVGSTGNGGTGGTGGTGGYQTITANPDIEIEDINTQLLTAPPPLISTAGDTGGTILVTETVIHIIFPAIPTDTQPGGNYQGTDLTYKYKLVQLYGETTTLQNASGYAYESSTPGITFAADVSSDNAGSSSLTVNGLDTSNEVVFVINDVTIGGSIEYGFRIEGSVPTVWQDIVTNTNGENSIDIALQDINIGYSGSIAPPGASAFFDSGNNVGVPSGENIISDSIRILFPALPTQTVPAEYYNLIPLGYKYAGVNAYVRNNDALDNVVGYAYETDYPGVTFAAGTTGHENNGNLGIVGVTGLSTSNSLTLVLEGVTGQNTLLLWSGAIDSFYGPVPQDASYAAGTFYPLDHAIQLLTPAVQGNPGSGASQEFTNDVNSQVTITSSTIKITLPNLYTSYPAPFVPGYVTTFLYAKIGVSISNSAFDNAQGYAYTTGGSGTPVKYDAVVSNGSITVSGLALDGDVILVIYNVATGGTTKFDITGTVECAVE